MSVFLRHAFMVCQFLAPPGWALAGSVTVDVDRDSGALVVVSHGATVEEIVGRLSEHSQFEFEPMGDAAHPRTLTGEFRGGTRSVLEQILDNESHVIVSAAGTGAVSRVVIYGRHDGEHATPGASAAPAVIAQPTVAPAPIAPQPVAPMKKPAASPVPTTPARAVQPLDKGWPRQATAPSPPVSRRTAMTTVASRGRP